MNLIEETEEPKMDDQSEIPLSIHRSFNLQRLTSFPSFKILFPYQTLTFCSNPIDSFKTLPPLPNLRFLDISNTQISSFQYLQSPISIESINFKSTPLSHYTEIILMTVIAFGPSIKMINGCQIPQTAYKRGLRLKPYLYSYLYNGWILLADNPIKVFNVNTRKRLVFLSLKSIPPLPTENHKEEIKDLTKSYASLSSCSSKSPKRSNYMPKESNGNDPNKFKKKATNVRKDILSQSMPRIPRMRFSKNSTKSSSNVKQASNNKSSSSKNQDILNKKGNSSQSITKGEFVHKRNKSLDLSNKSLSIKSSQQNVPQSEICDDTNSNAVDCSFKKIPININRKRKNDPNRNQSNIPINEPNISTEKPIIKDENDLMRQETEKTENKKVKSKIISNIERTSGTISTKGSKVVTFSPKSSKNSQEQKNRSLRSIQANQCNRTNKKKSNENKQMHINDKKKNDENESMSETSHPESALFGKESPKMKMKYSFKIKNVQNQENFDVEQNEYDNLIQINNDDHHPLINQQSESSDSFIESSLYLQEKKENKPKLCTQKLDHSNALKNLSSMKEIYKDLIFNIPNSDISDTSEFISDKDFDRQIEQIGCDMPSDSTTMADDFYL